MGLSKYKFKNRLLVGFGIIILLNTTSIIFCVSKLNDSVSDLKTMYNHPLTVSNAVREINTHINAIHRTMKDVVLSESESELNTHLKLIGISDSIIRKEFNIVFDRFLGDVKDVKKAYKNYIDWDIIRNEVIQLMKNGRQYEAAEITKGKGAKHIKVLLHSTQVMIDFAKKKADDLYYENLKEQDKAHAIIVLFLISTLIISVIIGLVISYSISDPIKALIRRVRKNFLLTDEAQHIESKSEQEMLEASVTKMEETSGQLRELNAELEAKVDERTAELLVNEAKLKEINNSLEDLVYVASHDLKVPLVSMEGFATILLENNADKLDEEGVFCLRRLQANARRMHNLVLSLLDLSRLNTHKNPYEEFSLEDIINKILMDLSLTIEEKRANVVFGELPELYGDKLRIENVFRNIIVNSLTYKGKSIGIYHSDHVIKIIDDGIGIPEDQLEKIFNPGEQLKIIRTNGVGMGLAYCKKVIEQHKGKIWAQSEGENKGTTINIKFNPKSIVKE